MESINLSTLRFLSTSRLLRLYLVVLGLVLSASSAQAQIILEPLPKDPTDIKRITITDLKHGRARIDVQRGKKTLSRKFRHFSPSENLERLDTTLLVPQGDSLEKATFVIHENRLVFALRGFQNEYLAYIFYVGQDSIIPMYQTGQTNWHLTTRNYFSYFLYDYKKHLLVDFNRERFADFKNLTGGVYNLGKQLDYLGEFRIPLPVKELQPTEDKKFEKLVVANLYPAYNKWLTENGKKLGDSPRVLKKNTKKG